MENNIASFTSASVFPAKLLRTPIKDKHGRIMPMHVQLNITNKCNFNCPFCSCSNRNKSEELSLDEIKRIMKNARRCGCKAVTCTGGGEFLLHPKVNEVIDYMYKLGIKIGLVTNGSRIDLLKHESLKKITWLRISASDYLDTNLKNLHLTLDDWFRNILLAVIQNMNVDWAFSYVLTSNPNYNILLRIIDFANKHNFTHVRIVSDLLDLDNVNMEKVKEYIELSLIGTDKIIWQPRQEFTKGTKRCLISLLKPVVGPDGKLYPCCGTQYALTEPSRDYEKTMCMGNAKDMDKLFISQKCFDGSVCSKCYYSDYNKSLDIITSQIKHLEFV